MIKIAIYIGLILVGITIAFNERISEDKGTYTAFFILVVLYFLFMVTVIAASF